MSVRTENCPVEDAMHTPHFPYGESCSPLGKPLYLTFSNLFPYAFFFQGFTGVAKTIGAILTLFVALQGTARVRWAEKLEEDRGVEPRIARAGERFGA